MTLGLNNYAPPTANAVCALPTEGAFMQSLTQAVTNSGDPMSGAVWLLDFVASYLKTQTGSKAVQAFNAWLDKQIRENK